MSYLLVLCAIFLALVMAMPPAHAQATFHFDLPEQPLANPLQAIAAQVGTNILFNSAVRRYEELSA